MSLEQIKEDWDKHKSIEISNAIENYSIYHCVNYICDTFLQENVCLLSDVISIYTKSHEKYCQHWNLSDSGTKLTNKGLLSKLGAVFEENFTVFTSKNKKLGTLLYCPGINIQTSMLLLLNQIKIIKKSSNKTEIVNQNQSPDISSSPQSQFQDLKINLQKMCRNLIDAQCYNEISLESFNVISFINTYLDPYVWNFFYSFFSSTPITDNTKCYLPQPDTSNKTLMFRCLNVISILLFAMDSRCQIPIPTLVAEVVDKYTSSSSECLKILNNFGICISKDTLQRYQNLIALRNKSEGLKLPPDTFVTVSIDNINKRFPNATVKVSDQCRGFDGTSIQLVLPNPSQLVLKNVEKGEFLIDSVTADCGTVFKVIKVGSEKSLFKSCLSTLSKTLATAKRNCDGFCIDEAISLHEENMASTIENLIKTCFNSNLNLVTSSNSNVKCNFSEEFAAFSFLTGSNVNIFSVSETIPSQISLVSAFHHPKSLGKHSCNILMTLEKTFCVLLPMDVYYSDFEYLNDELDFFKNIRCLNGVSHDPLTNNCGYLDVKNTENEKHKDIKPRKRVLVTESETFNSNNINIHQQSINEQPFFIQTKSIQELETNITHLSNEEKDIKQKFQSNMFTYCSKKYFTSQSDEILSNSLDSFKTVMSKTEQPNTCKSTVKYLEILEENADDKETIRNILYKLHDKFAIGRHFNNLVVVGDGKTYSHLIKLKEENIEDLQWMLPYLGDWHTLKNYQFVIMKIYLDLGLQSFIDLFHKGCFV